MGFLSWWKSWWKISRNLVGNLVILTHQANHLNAERTRHLKQELHYLGIALARILDPETIHPKGRAQWWLKSSPVGFAMNLRGSLDCVASPFFQKSKGPHISFKKQQTIAPRSECGFNIWRVFKKPKKIKNCQHPCLPEFKKPKQYNKIQ